MSKEYTRLLVDDQGDICWVTINRPGDRNSIDSALMSELEDLLATIEKTATRAIAFSGAGDTYFIGGADGVEMMQCDPESGQAFSVRIQNLFNRMEASPLILVAAINGLCFGGGFEFAMACDLRVAAKDAKLWVTEVVNVGLIPGWGGTQRLPRLVGIGRAKEIILTGRQIPADEALEIGLVNKVAPSDELHSEALFMAQQTADAAPIAVRLAKKTINMSYDVTLEEGNKEELEALLETTASEDFGIGVTAIFQKSKPKFKGK